MTKEEAKEFLYLIAGSLGLTDVEDYTCRDGEKMREAIETLDGEPRTGHWEWLTEDKYRCSNCNCETRVDECMNKPIYDFCPRCGAKMESEE